VIQKLGGLLGPPGFFKMFLEKNGFSLKRLILNDNNWKKLTEIKHIFKI